MNTRKDFGKLVISIIFIVITMDSPLTLGSPSNV